MAVKIRLRRMGSRNAAFYRIVVQDSRRATTGKFIEILGWYDPKQEGNNFSLNLDRVDYWLSHGAQSSETVGSLVKKARTLPVEQAVAGEVTEEEVPATAIEAEEAAEEVAEEEAPVEAAEEVVADTVEEAETEVPAAEEPAAEAPADEEEAESASDEDTADKEKS